MRTFGIAARWRLRRIGRVTKQDRRNWLAISGSLGLAALMLLTAAYGIHLWSTGEHDRYVLGMLLGGAVVGIASMSVAVEELVWRLRHGPQGAGRHSREQ